MNYVYLEAKYKQGFCLFQSSIIEALCVCYLSSFRFGAVFLWDSGSTVGDLSGHSKRINSVDIKQTRPYRLVTGSDDSSASFFEGPPFKFKFTIPVSSSTFSSSLFGKSRYKCLCNLNQPFCYLQQWSLVCLFPYYITHLSKNSWVCEWATFLKSTVPFMNMQIFHFLLYKLSLHSVILT